ncbi:MAG: porin [Pseudomonadota bacterium]|jgi:predicted porin|nr:porin [Rubrivivax sp.]MCA3258719.1 porin [Rubrivivax sp.]MCE2912714.1 porin [Rubrivivax sp.]MCZ8030294.1 porin [Rubrivivax sp.]
MKKSLLALAALTAFAGVASAQSSVTLFGVVDLNARNVKNGSAGSLKTLSTDGLASTRFGVRGVEDLGGGLRAGFWLEAGFGADTAAGASAGADASGNRIGTGGLVFNRRATLSLLGGFGEVRLGRDYTPTFWNHTIFDPFGTNGVASQTNLITPASGASGSNTTRVLGYTSNGVNSGTTTGTVVRADNSIGYFLPTMGGLYGQVMIAAGEGFTGAKYVGGRFGYSAGPINVAVAVGRTEVTSSADLSAVNFGGSWNLGFATLMAQYHSYEADRTGAAGFTLDRSLKNWLVGAVMPMGASSFKFSYAKSSGEFSDTVRDGDATQLGLGYQYDLSKRTALYANYSRVKNNKGARFYASGSGPLNAGTDFTSTGYEFGVRHSF